MQKQPHIILIHRQRDRQTERQTERRGDIPSEQCRQNVPAHQDVFDSRRSCSNLTTQQVVKYLCNILPTLQITSHHSYHIKCILSLSLSLSLSLHFNGHFSRWTWVSWYHKCLNPKLHWSQGWWRWWWQLELQDVQSSSQIITTNKPTPSLLQAGCRSCRPTNSVKALKGKMIKVLRADANTAWRL